MPIEIFAGITEPHPDPALRIRFLTLVHKRSGYAFAGEILEPATGRNYYRAGTLLLNAAAELVAEVEPGESLVFTEVRDPIFVSRAGFGVAALADLLEPIRPDHLRLLDAAERADVAYHQPANVGEMLFNWFD